ncbi:MAG: sigma-70 family RNA polymerase sigma factor [Bdellovibrionota bacterium]
MEESQSQKERDMECVLRVQAGDESALAEAYDRFTPLLFPVALRILRRPSDAEDVLQEVWMQVWKGAAHYDPRRGTVAAWLLTIARSRALDKYRSLSSRRAAEDAAGDEPSFSPGGDPPPDPSAGASHKQLSEKVRSALASLKDEQRRALEIAYFEGLSQSEVAERMKAPLGTVKSWMRQGLLKLRELVPPEDFL